MNFTFENYGAFNVTLVSTKGSTVTFNEVNGMKDCIDFITYHLTHDTRITTGYITDANTGELVATLERGENG